MLRTARSGRGLVLVLIVALVLAGVGWLVWSGRSPAGVAPPPVATEPRTEAAATPPTPIEATDEVERAPVAASAPAEPSTPKPTVAEPEAPATERRVRIVARGVVLDLDGRPVANVGVRYSDATAVLAWSGADGSFELVLERHEGVLVAAGDEHATVRGSISKPGDSGELHLIVVAPTVDLAGIVVDDADRPIEHAIVRLDLPQSAFAGFPRALDATEQIARDAVTDATGRFAFTGAPGTPKARLEIAKNGFETSTTPVPTSDAKDLRIELERLADERRRVGGVVLLASLEPVEGATVRLGSFHVKTDAQGRFELWPKNWLDPKSPLVAAKPGLQPAVVPSFGALVAPGEPPVPEQRLVLGGPTLSIRGRVRDAHDHPVAGYHVVLHDGVNATPGMFPPTFAEELAAASNGGRTRCTSDGGFEIAGLSPRAYVLRCYDEKSLVSFMSEPIEAGRSDVVLRVPADAVWKKLTGRVVARDGSGIANARVTLHLITARADSGWTSIQREPVTTDEHGEFTLTDVPHFWTYLSIDGDAVLPMRWEFDEVDPTVEVVITAPRRCHFRFESTADAGERPDALELLDEAGQSETVWLINANGWTSMTRTELTEGRSLVISASDGKKTAVLFRGEREVGRVAVTLSAGEVLVVRK